MSDALIQLRPFVDDDYPMVSEWFDSHGAMPCPKQMLPKLGIIVERGGIPEAAMWLYMDNSVGVCFLERCVTRPGLSVAHASESLLSGVRYMKVAAAEMDYGVMFLRAYPGLARFAKKEGFFEDDRTVVSMVTLTKEKTCPQ